MTGTPNCRLGWLFTACLVAALAPQPAAQRPPTIAAAASLNLALTEIAARFERAQGGRIELVFGASGTLTRQIQDGAPFEMFLAADEEFPNQLAAAHIVVVQIVRLHEHTHTAQRGLPQDLRLICTGDAADRLGDRLAVTLEMHVSRVGGVKICQEYMMIELIRMPGRSVLREIGRRCDHRPTCPGQPAHRDA